jgi:hypothetical protein
MKLPSFFDQVPLLRVRDPLAEVLGCAEGGVLEYSYADAVRLTGHSCPTVAASYWLTWRSMQELYPTELPVRGGVKVEFREDARIGSTGVVACVVQMLTGAAGSSGFKGVAGRFGRAGLIRFSPGLPLSLRFTRLDNGAQVNCCSDAAAAVPMRRHWRNSAGSGRRACSTCCLTWPGTRACSWCVACSAGSRCSCQGPRAPWTLLPLPLGEGWGEGDGSGEDEALWSDPGRRLRPARPRGSW